jgi:predicted transporter
MLFFGIAGATLFIIGFLAGVVALVLRFGYGIGFRPLLNLVETMVITGIVLFGFGLLGEIVAGVQEETRSLARAFDRLDKPDLRD